MNFRHFFSELKRRNVYRVAVAYAVVGWLIAQIATQIFPFLEIPNWIVRLVIVLIAIGFPIALVIAWAFEATPEGIKRTEVADAMPPSIGRKKHAWIYIVVIAGAISAALFFLGRYTVGNKAATATPNDIPDKSIAVLPFDSLSEDKSNAYFAEGVQDEILTRLAKVADLKVISRTSTQHFKSAPDNLPQIAKQLGVMNILEGTVQKSNDQVRVNVQLINAVTDAHLWADIYDRKLTDLFAVESDIAKTIADTLQAKLTGSEKSAMSKKPTENPEAYELYLKGRFFWNKRNAADLKKSIDYFDQAIQKDPNYALAYAAKAQALILLPAYDGGAPNDCFPAAKGASEKALTLDPSSSEAQAALASLKCLYDFDYPGSVAAYERTIELNPNDATAHQWLANQTLANMGDSERELKEMKRALDLDPLSLVINTNLGVAYFHAGYPDQAIAQLRKTLEMDSEFYYARYNLALFLEMAGKTSEALTEFQKTIAITDDTVPLAYLGNLYAKVGQKKEALEILNRLRQRQQRKQQYTPAYSLGIVYLGLGDRDQALNYFEQSYREHDGFNVGQVRIDPLLKPLHGDSRFNALAEKIIPAREFGPGATASK